MNPLPRKERDKLLRRADILNAAARVFAEKGYHKASMSDIAKQAEYAVGTIYLYFKDKQALYLALTDEKVDELIKRVKERIGKAHGGLEKIRALIDEELNYFEENDDFFRIYFSQGSLDRWAIKDKPSRETVEKLMQFLDYISGVIKKAQDENVIRKGLDPKRTAHLLGGMIKSVVIPWLKDKPLKAESLKGLSGFILDAFLNGTVVK
ncbi:MAG: TetR/AcrR family transcriptional regulator [Candidatus Omnitrophica bacterium]|nr:TetR/AcrR family transcriptional regulator [Candidatus Omnitrophota bacterium]MBU1923493.1 TetR/AcrR family transcriptional regulator [Candidatus Omnitrophota bacterium]